MAYDTSKKKFCYLRKDAESTKEIVDELFLLCSEHCLENLSIDVFFSSD